MKIKFLKSYLIPIVLTISVSLIITNRLFAGKNSEKIPNAPVTADASVDRNEITIGDRIRFRLKVEYEHGIEVTFPEFGEKLAEFTIKDYGRTEPEKQRNGRLASEEWYVLDTFLTGSYTIPSLTVKYKTTANEIKEQKTEEIVVNVISVMNSDDGEIEDIRDIKEPVSINVNYTKIYIIIGGVLGLLAIIGGTIYFIKHRKQKKQDVPPLIRLAHEIAYDELKELNELDLIAKGMIKEHFYRLANIVRYYIEKRFSLMAPERTTEEFLPEMANADVLEREHKILIRKFLEQCDLVKFAKYVPDKEETDAAYNAAKKLVDETKQLTMNN